MRLARLAALSNKDKHRFLTPAFTATTAAIPGRVERLAGIPAKVEVHFPFRLLRDKAEIMRWRDFSPSLDAKVNVQGAVRIEIALGAKEITLAELFEIYNAVIEIVDVFEPSFAPRV